MRMRSLSHLSERALLSGLDEAEARQRCGDADVLAHLAEVDYRRLYAKRGYPSMFMWCVRARHYSEDVAAKRIRAARAARRFPVLLDMLADGRLHLTAIALLSHRLTPGTARELLAAAVHQSKREIERMLATRFPQPDVATVVRPIAAASSLPAPGPVNICARATSPAAVAPTQVAGEPAAAAQAPAAEAGSVAPPAQAFASPAAPPPSAFSRVAPLAPQRYAVQFTMDEAMHADLTRAQELLGPQADDDRVRAVFRRALRELVTTLEKRRCGATNRPRAQRRGESAKGARIPAQVRREVRRRDGDRCAWVTEDGRRCEARSRLQYDHIEPVGKGGGGGTADNVRLLCPAHNQLAAEHEYGEGLMHRIRERNRRATEARRERRITVAAPPVQRTAPPAPA
jgi:hypothetical protein